MAARHNTILPMLSIEYPETTKHIIAHNNKNIFHYVVVTSRNCFTTGQPYMDIFDTEDEARAAYPKAFLLDVD